MFIHMLRFLLRIKVAQIKSFYYYISLKEKKKKRKNIKAFKIRKRLKKITKLVLLAPNKMNCCFLIGNKPKSSISITSLPLPHPTHQQRRNTAGAQHSVFCLKARQNSGLWSACTVQWEHQRCIPLLEGSALLVKWDGIFRLFSMLLRLVPHQPLQVPLSPGQGLPSRVAPTQLWAVNCPSLLGSLSHSHRLQFPLPPH